MLLAAYSRGHDAGGGGHALVNCRNHGDTIVLDIDEEIADAMGVEAGSFMTLDEVGRASWKDQ